MVLALLLSLGWSPVGRPAPAPNEEQRAKEKLDSLKKKLPDIVTDAVNKSQRWASKFEGSVDSLRQVGPAEAKLTVRLDALGQDPTGTIGKNPYYDEIAVIYLSYYDGAWTTRHYEGSWSQVVGGQANPNHKGVRFLMAAIDRVSEK
jgi:hypothetical protein